jgi:hypothetical protein
VPRCAPLEKLKEDKTREDKRMMLRELATLAGRTANTLGKVGAPCWVEKTLRSSSVSTSLWTSASHLNSINTADRGVEAFQQQRRDFRWVFGQNPKGDTEQNFAILLLFSPF